jgi:ATP-binding cassette, subfamily G (WHITE), member 2, PDR
MYRVSPLTYFIGSMVATGLHDRPVVCSTSELSQFNPPNGTTCGDYMKTYISKTSGNLLNPEATSDCRYCPLTVSDQFIASSGINWDHRWRNSGIMWAYICFNVFMAVMLYYLFRVRKWDATGKKKRIAKARYWLCEVGLHVRALFVGHFWKGKEERNEKAL